jgi:hypothetical protein
LVISERPQIGPPRIDIASNIAENQKRPSMARRPLALSRSGAKCADSEVCDDSLAFDW